MAIGFGYIVELPGPGTTNSKFVNLIRIYPLLISPKSKSKTSPQILISQSHLISLICVVIVFKFPCKLVPDGGNGASK